MANEITLPRLGWDMTEGALDAWLKKEGEFVQEGEILFEMEGDKAVQEVEALDSGYLRILPNGPRQGEKVPVGTVIGYLVPENELATFQLPGVSQPELVQQTAKPPASETNQAAETVVQNIHSAADGRSRRIYISPYAKKLADGLGVEWHSIKGSGLAGRIMAKDVELAASLQKTSPPAAVSAVSKPAAVEPVQTAPSPAGQRIEMTQIRKKIAEHMAYSAHTVAPVTLTAEVDATELVALRKALKDDAVITAQALPSYNDLLAKLCAQALQEHPNVNARIEGDEIVQLAAVNIALAVDTDRGLIVPVLRDVQAKSLRQIARESAVLVEKTRNGSVSYADLQGATFTITNLGMFGIDAFTPIIDLPQCAILGVGRIVAKQVVLDFETERVAIRQRMVLSLTFDHRLIDGAQAARFLQRVMKLVENPYLWLVG
jgi:pyruvate dehydrogenase E2 component (dihydrolipoamide acetyltransferase)